MATAVWDEHGLLLPWPVLALQLPSLQVEIIALPCLKGYVRIDTLKDRETPDTIMTLEKWGWKCGEAEQLAQKSNITSCGWTREEQSWIPTLGLSHSAIKARMVHLIWYFLHAALKWHKTGSTLPKSWDTCCCNLGCAKVPEKKAWVKGGKISAHALQHLLLFLKNYGNTVPAEMHVPRNGQSWG